MTQPDNPYRRDTSIFCKAVFALALLSAAVFPGQGIASGKIQYYSDPEYQSMYSAEPHPMQDFIHLAERGNTRAQFILGDLYTKGKGGLGRDYELARYWLLRSTQSDAPASFIRLAALAKRLQKPAEAYMWYALALDRADDDKTVFAYVTKERDALVASTALTEDDIRDAEQKARQWRFPQNLPYPGKDLDQNAQEGKIQPAAEAGVSAPAETGGSALRRLDDLDDRTAGSLPPAQTETETPDEEERGGSEESKENEETATSTPTGAAHAKSATPPPVPAKKPKEER